MTIYPIIPDRTACDKHSPEPPACSTHLLHMFIVSSQLSGILGPISIQAAEGRRMTPERVRPSGYRWPQLALGILFLVVLSLWVALWAVPLPII
jgi:hypothetical protein